ncbi:MAG: hydantoinase B/oxoprolinase family protein [bacterium]|nr:hydantoinase B/oxoprolinase family protein [bacterium]
MKTPEMDPILLEVLRAQMQGVVEEMGEMMTRCGHTVFVKETQDFVVALVTLEGEVAFCSERVGLWVAIGQNYKAVIDAGGPYAEGDVWITNDPHESRGLVAHLPDIFGWRPIYHGGELVCFACAFLHFTDVGGMAPGSVAPRAVDLFQEGTIIPVTKLVQKGEIREEILRFFLRNTRTPERCRGDLLALLGTLRRAEERLHHLAEKFGSDTIQQGLYKVLSYAEEQSRAIIREIPDGDHVFWDYIEGDFAPGGRPIRMRLNLQVRGDELTLDFTGTDPQVSAAFNIPTYGDDSHYLLVLGVVNFFRTVKTDLVYNSGLVRPVKARNPVGTLLNPEPNAPCGARQATFFRLADVVLGALCQALPDRLPAAGCGQGSIMLVSTPEVATGTRVVSIVQPLVGGSGARPAEDGTEGVDFTTGFYRNIPSEVLESETPVVVEEYALRPDSGGAGRRRGGSGLKYAMRVLSPGSIVTSRALERFYFQPWGREGGAPGANGRARLKLPNAPLQEIKKIDVLELPANAVLFVETAGGGGFGPPWERPAEDVLRDVEDGFVSPQVAEDVYGVILSGGSVDAAATGKRRAGMLAQSNGFGRFSFGEARERYESVWPDALQLAVNGATEGLPATIREHVRLEMLRRIEENDELRKGADLAALRALSAEILESLKPSGESIA